MVRGGDHQVVEAGAPPDRGMSELIGMVLLIGIVLVGAVTVVVLGAGAISDAEDRTRTEAAQSQLRALDANLESMAFGDDAAHARFDFDESLVADYRIDRSGSINVTIDRNGTCSVEQSLSSVIHQDSRGYTVGYEAGGVWRAGLEGGSAVSPPAVAFEGGRLDIGLMNLTGQLDQATNVARLNVTETRNRSRHAMRTLFQGDCIRPDNVTLWVNSTFQAGWANYLESELGGTVGTVDSFPNGTVKAFLPQDALHPSTDDSLNKVIDLGGAPYMTNATLDGNLPDGPVTVNASKSADNTYAAYAEPLTRRTLDIGREIELDGTNITGPPIDASIILDRSGSMGSGFGSKLHDAKQGAKTFVGTLNESRDRVGVVYYETDAEHKYIDGEDLFSSDRDAVNTTIDSATGGMQTAIYKGIDYSNALFDLKGNQSRKRVAILLTDGKNTEPPDGGGDADDATIDAAEIADKRDITIYTIGYGSNADENLMKDVANETGGSYCFANNNTAVIDCFEEFGDLINPQSAIASTPLTSNVTTGSSVFDADIPGDTSHIASVTEGGETFLNLNDPTAPSLFSYSFPHPDDEYFRMNVTTYDCAPDGWNLTDETRTVGGETMVVARCTDIGDVNDSYGADLYVDGQRPDTVLETTYADWQTDVNESLDAFPSVNINATTGELEAESNHALVAFDLPPEGGGSQNTLMLLLQVGLSDRELATEAVQVRIGEATLGN
jgi:hypothetical protein